MLSTVAVIFCKPPSILCSMCRFIKCKIGTISHVHTIKASRARIGIAPLIFNPYCRKVRQCVCDFERCSVRTQPRKRLTFL